MVHTNTQFSFTNIILILCIGSAIEASLKQLAERRTDIFGVGDEETAIGKKIGEEEVRKDDRVSFLFFSLFNFTHYGHTKHTHNTPLSIE